MCTAWFFLACVSQKAKLLKTPNLDCFVGLQRHGGACPQNGQVWSFEQLCIMGKQWTGFDQGKCPFYASRDGDGRSRRHTVSGLSVRTYIRPSVPFSNRFSYSFAHTHTHEMGKMCMAMGSDGLWLLVMIPQTDFGKIRKNRTIRSIRNKWPHLGFATASKWFILGIGITDS